MSKTLTFADFPNEKLNATDLALRQAALDAKDQKGPEPPPAPAKAS
jgi:hypothetical protein